MDDRLKLVTARYSKIVHRRLPESSLVSTVNCSQCDTLVDISTDLGNHPET